MKDNLFVIIIYVYCHKYILYGYRKREMNETSVTSSSHQTTVHEILFEVDRVLQFDGIFTILNSSVFQIGLDHKTYFSLHVPYYIQGIFL